LVSYCFFDTVISILLGYAKVRWLYAQLGIADRTEIEFFQGGHSINGEGTLFPDGIHPNADGAKLMAEAIFPLSTPDLNEDGIVDAADMCIIIDHWGKSYPLCDVGPAPFGDDIIDVQDMVVLSEYLFTYPGVVAYWTLDETEGNIAYDSVGICNGTLIGGPVWQPDGGIVAGALQFDGIDDFISTGFVLSPADGAFSVFAWIKGGLPGHVVLSQADNENWLLADPSDGNLMTELKGSGRSAGALKSQTIVTDDNWHRIGLVFDGLYRKLYVDDLAVAEDTQEGIKSSSNGLYIGASKMM
jgi:hypothetical protein